MITLVDALKSIRPKAIWTLQGEELEWHDEVQVAPTMEELKAEVNRLQEEYDSQQFARDRVLEYPEIGDQLDALFHAGVFPPEMASQIQAVKDKFPKT